MLYTYTPVCVCVCVRTRDHVSAARSTYFLLTRGRVRSLQQLHHLCVVSDSGAVASRRQSDS